MWGLIKNVNIINKHFYFKLVLVCSIGCSIRVTCLELYCLQSLHYSTILYFFVVHFSKLNSV